jgi:hypothetical protein
MHARADHCTHCHGQRTRTAGLLLQQRQAHAVVLRSDHQRLDPSGCRARRAQQGRRPGFLRSMMPTAGREWARAPPIRSSRSKPDTARAHGQTRDDDGRRLVLGLHGTRTRPPGWIGCRSEHVRDGTGRVRPAGLDTRDAHVVVAAREVYTVQARIFLRFSAGHYYELILRISAVHVLQRGALSLNLEAACWPVGPVGHCPSLRVPRGCALHAFDWADS